MRTIENYLLYALNHQRFLTRQGRRSTGSTKDLLKIASENQHEFSSQKQMGGQRFLVFSWSPYCIDKPSNRAILKAI